MQNASSNRKPIYLLADSQLFFHNLNDSKLVASLRRELESDKPNVTKAAYIGASNNDEPAFFELFVAAMDNINTHECRMLHSSAPISDADKHFLETADLILLAGGETRHGWDRICQSNMHEIIAQRYCSGAVLVGVSAGAIQLGMGFVDVENGATLINTLRLIPYYISTNEDDDDWQELRRLLMTCDKYCKGFGISSGGGLIYHPDSSIEPLHRSLYEFEIKDANGREAISSNILLPP